MSDFKNEYNDHEMQESFNALSNGMKEVMILKWINPLQAIIDEANDLEKKRKVGERETFVRVEKGKSTFHPKAQSIAHSICGSVCDIHVSVGTPFERPFSKVVKEDVIADQLALMRLVFHALEFGPGDSRCLEFCWGNIGPWKS